MTSIRFLENIQEIDKIHTVLRKSWEDVKKFIAFDMDNGWNADRRRWIDANGGDITKKLDELSERLTLKIDVEAEKKALRAELSDDIEVRARLEGAALVFVSKSAGKMVLSAKTSHIAEEVAKSLRQMAGDYPFVGALPKAFADLAMICFTKALRKKPSPGDEDLSAEDQDAILWDLLKYKGLRYNEDKPEETHTEDLKKFKIFFGTCMSEWRDCLQQGKGDVRRVRISRGLPHDPEEPGDVQEAAVLPH